jgi:hypothetical protein
LTASWVLIIPKDRGNGMDAAEIEKVKARFIKYGVTIEDCSHDGKDTRKHNRAQIAQLKLFEQIKDMDFAPQLFAELLEHERRGVRHYAAYFSLELNNNVEDALRVYEENAAQTEDRVIKLGATLALQRWHKTGLWAEK